MLGNSNFKAINFSILMANFNNEKFIETAINSVIAQTYPDWELIIVDDCSYDNSLEKISLYLNDKRIKLIKHEKNSGYGGALKSAASASSNRILCILDADDKLHEDALDTIAEAYKENPEYGFIYSTMWGCDSELKNCRLSPINGPIVPKYTNIFQNRVSHFKTFLKEAYQKTYGFDMNQKRSVDKDIIYKLEEVTEFKFINKPLYYYRLHKGGISQGKNKFNARVYHYIAKYKTYRRRLGTELPNFTLKDLYKEYLKITFHQLINVMRYVYKKFKISVLIEKTLNRIPYIPENVKKKVKFFDKLSK